MASMAGEYLQYEAYLYWFFFCYLKQRWWIFHFQCVKFCHISSWKAIFLTIKTEHNQFGCWLQNHRLCVLLLVIVQANYFRLVFGIILRNSTLYLKIGAWCLVPSTKLQHTVQSHACISSKQNSAKFTKLIPINGD